MSEEVQPRSKAPPPLFKHKSWSPDNLREEVWTNRKRNYRLRHGKSLGVTDDDLEELQACFDLGFTFDSPDLDPSLSKTFPALGFYYAVNNSLSRSSSSTSSGFSNCDFPTSPVSSSVSLFNPGDDPEVMKTRLKHWAQLVVCAVRQSRQTNYDLDFQGGN
ncbi:Hypothetical predicted protein [Olea europaea subsp. europaea]|uniref:Uncharacterized protein n=1 Tax=Olea europaea subsp. europaea TaxID=158383 RepID=A0A8S0RG98_OLEEU|nr:Hypothetical predicted protein [Olea europaea subsp. europaea]